MDEKVVTSKNALTATADAIREKIGSEDLLEWVNGSGFAEAVAAIEAGGGSGRIATGYFIPQEDLGSSCDLTITHNLGEIPKCAIVLREPNADGFMSEVIAAGEVAFSIAINNEKKGMGYYYKTAGYTSDVELAVGAASNNIYLSSSSTVYLNGSCVYNCTAETAKLYPIKNKTKKFAAGSKYRWILMTEAAYNALQIH